MSSLSFKRRSTILTIAILAAVFAVTFYFTTAAAQGGTCPVVPSTLGGQPYVTVKMDQDHVNIRSGPNSYLYDKVGFLFPGESAPALGRTEGGDWIQIVCPGVPNGVGWVYSANVTLTSSGFLQIVEPPPAPEVTIPIDSTMIAGFEIHTTATRLPTYTPPAITQVLPTYTETIQPRSSGWMAPLISGFALVGLLGLVFSLLFRR